ncbi:MAG: hypothetical protein WCB11_14235 [Terriglobales bacterium]
MTQKSVSLSRKDFQFIADTIRLLPSFDVYPINGAKLGEPTSDVVRFSAIVSSFADALAGTNPNFDRSRFIAACNGKESEKPDMGYMGRHPNKAAMDILRSLPSAIEKPEPQFSQKECEILDYLHEHGDSTRKQIQKALRTTDKSIDRLLAADLVKQVGRHIRAVSELKEGK